MIRKMGMVFTHGIMAGNIKATLITIIVMAMGSSSILKESFNIRDFGIMGSKQIEI